VEHKRRVIGPEELETLLLHRGRMLLLSRIRAYDLRRRTLWGEYDLTGDCLFYDREMGGVPSWLSFELMAQGIAALAGIAGRERGEPPRPGLILSFSGLKLEAPLFREGTTALIRVREEDREAGLCAFSGAVSLGEKGIARARLTVLAE
jgi:predicted hotdog family 3-hydroxylacyl-ACP dehydratase